MNKEKIIRKLTSRKLWLALSAFVSGILTALGHKDTAVTVTGLIMQGAAVISYIIAEGLIDAANKPSDSEEPTIEYRYLDEEGREIDPSDLQVEPDGTITVLAYDDYYDDGSPKSKGGVTFPQAVDEPCEECDLTKYVEGGMNDD